MEVVTPPVIEGQHLAGVGKWADRLVSAGVGALTLFLGTVAIDEWRALRQPHQVAKPSVDEDQGGTDGAPPEKDNGVANPSPGLPVDWVGVGRPPPGLPADVAAAAIGMGTWIEHGDGSFEFTPRPLIKRIRGWEVTTNSAKPPGNWGGW